jgi:rod shape-determining protein MreD
MIMPRGQQLLLPVNPGFITASLLLALAINLLPLGPMVWIPDALILALAFWGVHQPWRVGMGIGFVLGLCMDVHQSSLLGQHALAYTVLMYGTRVFHRRVLWLRPLQQPWQMVGLFAAATRPTCWQAFWRGGACRVGVSCWRLCWRPSCGPWSVGCCWRRSAARSMGRTSFRDRRAFQERG